LADLSIQRTQQFCKLFLLTMVFAVLGCEGEKPIEPKPKQEKVQETISNTEVIFDDLTTKVGLSHTYQNGEESNEMSILQTIGGGVAAFDYDRDGWDDLFFPGGGVLKDKTISGLVGSLWQSRSGKNFLNVGSLAGTDLVSKYTHGATSGDLNSDGFSDLLVTGYDGLQMFINQGDGTFVESALASGLSDTVWSTSAAFGDFDNDGFLDIYIAHYVNWSFSNHPPCKSLSVPDVCAPGNFDAFDDLVYHNNGNGTFTAKTTELGLVKGGKGLGVMVADFDRDAKSDVYVANDTTNNFYYENQGGVFKEMGLASGTAVDDLGSPQGSMGLCLLDYDQDLMADIWVCNYENQAFALYKNDGQSNYRYVTSATGLMALGTTYVAFGTASGDFDSDGDEDVVVANGHVMQFHQGGGNSSQNPLYLTNTGKKRFTRQLFPESEYFGKKWRGRGVVAFDLDHDGDLDLSFSHVNQPSVILENKSKSPNQWWILELIGTQSNRDAIGASVVFKSNQRSILRNVVGGGSYLSQNPYYIHVGLPADEKLEEVEILWPTGTRQKLTELAANTRTQIVEPQVNQ
jgi:hypothetical protein